MSNRNFPSSAYSRIAKAAGILSIAAIAGLAAVNGSEAKGKHHGFHGHKSHFAFDYGYGYYPYYDGYRYDRRCYFRGWDGRIHKRRYCRYGHWRNRYWR